MLGSRRIEIRLFDKVKKTGSVFETLLALIQKEKTPCFLLPAVLHYLSQFDDVRFSDFELWLNQSSGLNFEENAAIRGKIAGKWIARGDYQNLFPIGMGKVYEGTHFVTAHKSPDLDTTIASFWGWLDAFAARVSDGLHIWNVPGGPPTSQIEIEWLFNDLFTKGVFTHLPITRTVLGLHGSDFVSQKGFVKKLPQDAISAIDHEREAKAVVIVDEANQYLGDWRVTDVESVRQVLVLLGSCLRWFETALQLKMIAVFATSKPKLSDMKKALEELVEKKVSDAEPAQEFTHRQCQYVDEVLKKALHVKGGLNASFDEVMEKLCKLAGVPFGGPSHMASVMQKKGIFEKETLTDDREKIFSYLEENFQALDTGIVKIRARLEQIDIALKTKAEVFYRTPTTVTTKSDLDEIKSKIGARSYLTVVNEKEPVGIIQASDLNKPILATVSLRDFCNRDEMGIPNFFEVISVIDHHKSALNTFSPPLAIVADVQSSNTLVAQKAFEINDFYEDRDEFGYFIHKERAYIEYLHFLYGIIDDTDLLSKVSSIDVDIVVQLLNRLKSIQVGKKVEILNLRDIPRDKLYAKKAAARILQNDEMYSLYSRVYEYREKEVEKNLAQGNVFADTKEQNGCCRVGQTKIFSANLKALEKHLSHLRKAFLDKAHKVTHEKPEIDLHIHMISTIVDAEEVYKGKVGEYKHQDELWIWIPHTEQGLEHLKFFITAMHRSPGLKNNRFTAEVLGHERLQDALKDSFIQNITCKKSDQNMIILRYNASTLNSRKSMISPFLPSLLTRSS